MFKVGDIVTCVRDNGKGYVGLGGTVINEDTSHVYVRPDADSARKKNTTSTKWVFLKSSYTLELLDDASTHIPEDWS